MRSPLQEKHRENYKLEVNAGATKSTNVSKTAEINQEVTDKWGKQKVSLLEGVLGNPGLVQETAAPTRQKETIKKLCHNQCVFCREIGLWKNECPHHRETVNPKVPEN